MMIVHCLFFIWGKFLKTRVGAAASALLLTSLLASCGASGAEPAPTVTVTATVTAEPTEAAATAESSAPVSAADGTVGESVVNGGVDLTIKKASAVDTVDMTMDINSPKVTQEKPPAGGRYIRIDTVVENAGKKSMDLTCMGPVQVVAVDSEDREFNSIDDLYKIVDNPGCNDQLQPGFKDEMTWVFMVPEDAEITGVSFYDSQQSMYDQPSFVAFDKSL